jgi:probable F420-dependent oxidoreductase
MIAAHAARAEALGFSGLWTLESGVGAVTAHMSILDGLQTLAYAAAVTEQVRLGIAIIVLPRRNPVLLAKELSSLDHLTGGRLIAGVGLGNDDDRVAALGVPTDRRVRRLTEAVEAMRALWSQSPASYDGEIFSFSGADLTPKPVQTPLPVWFGAGRPPALRRAARLADGWIGAGSSSSDAFVDQARLMEELLAEAGRDPRAFPVAKRVYVAVEDDEQRAADKLAAVLDRMYGWPGMTGQVAVCGPAERCAEELRRLFDAGADELALTPLYEPAAQLEALAEVARLLG